MTLYLIGLNHASAPLTLREKLYFDPSNCAERTREIAALPGVSEAVLLSTCNRTEVTFISDNPKIVIAYLAEYASLSYQDISPWLYQYQDEEAIRHIFRVACGLDSLVVGETQILGQLRIAFEMARSAACACSNLHHIFQHAISVGKRARAETSISQGAFSIGRAGVELTQSLFSSLDGSQILILGAGKVSTITARHLSAAGACTIIVANRTHAHAEELAKQLNGRAIHYQELPQALAEIDILISSTSAPHYVLTKADLQPIMLARGGKSLCLIDLAVPRDIDPAVSEIANVHLYNIDDLHLVTEAKAQIRQADIPIVEKIIEEEVIRCQHRQAGQQAAEVISALHQSFDQLRRDELVRNTNILQELSIEQQNEVERMTIALTNKLLHLPTVRLKALLAENVTNEALYFFEYLFGLNDECPQRTNDE